MNQIRSVWNRIYNQGAERSIKAKRNIIGMLFVKGGNILINLLLVPITINYVNSGTYGVWLTLSSMVAWISFFDIGINNGLKNKLTEAFAHDDILLSRKLISTTYAFLFLIFIPIMVITLILVPFINWNSVLNLYNISQHELIVAVSILVSYFCINFVLSTINIVLTSDQRPADASMRTLIEHFVSLVVIVILIYTTTGSLIKLCVALCFVPLLIILLFNITLFRGRYKTICPSFSFVDFGLAPSLLKQGVQFFIIQIAAIIQYQMINFLIIRYFGADDVTAYNICFKYFNVLYMIWGIIVTPLWVACTDAIVRKDVQWIESAQKKYLHLFFFFILIGCLMLASSSVVYHIWIGDVVHIDWFLSFWVMFYNFVLMFGTIYVYFINGSGQLKVQTISSCVSPLFFIALCLFLIKQHFGVSAIIIASILSNFNGYLLAPIQSRYIVNKLKIQQKMSS